ncbi:hypothetical protein K505DRAFT_359630 [Melanomma pulvis-pyrius CBS 109.77]|uniref:Uncharacterized protein n=1 Tax=Melanomma pulvis-pyrius CBS 109.77 TaxID=1314802 RepID=A0A6A6XJK5_9PLEO|nr:hypothetical protein K505DRAFT_359630 [Melanomma pulvis-pyrius CBS 109.77]
MDRHTKPEPLEQQIFVAVIALLVLLVAAPLLLLLNQAYRRLNHSTRALHSIQQILRAHKAEMKLDEYEPAREREHLFEQLLQAISRFCDLQDEREIQGDQGNPDLQQDMHFTRVLINSLIADLSRYDAHFGASHQAGAPSRNLREHQMQGPEDAPRPASECRTSHEAVSSRDTNVRQHREDAQTPPAEPTTPRALTARPDNEHHPPPNIRPQRLPRPTAPEAKPRASPRDHHHHHHHHPPAPAAKPQERTQTQTPLDVRPPRDVHEAVSRLEIAVSHLSSILERWRGDGATIEGRAQRHLRRVEAATSESEEAWTTIDGGERNWDRAQCEEAGREGRDMAVGRVGARGGCRRSSQMLGLGLPLNGEGGIYYHPELGRASTALVEPGGMDMVGGGDAERREGSVGSSDSMLANRSYSNDASPIDGGSGEERDGLLDRAS